MFCSASTAMVETPVFRHCAGSLSWRSAASALSLSGIWWAPSFWVKHKWCGLYSSEGEDCPLEVPYFSQYQWIKDIQGHSCLTMLVCFLPDLVLSWLWNDGSMDTYSNPTYPTTLHLQITPIHNDAFYVDYTVYSINIYSIQLPIRQEKTAQSLSHWQRKRWRSLSTPTCCAVQRGRTSRQLAEML